MQETCTVDVTFHSITMLREWQKRDGIKQDFHCELFPGSAGAAQGC